MSIYRLMEQAEKDSNDIELIEEMKKQLDKENKQ